MTETLSLRDRYLALADGKQLQILDATEWVDFDPGRHPIKLANCFRVKPAPTPTSPYGANLATVRELQKLVAHCGANPFDHLAGLLSQLSNIVAGYADYKCALQQIENGDLSRVRPDTLLKIGQAANVLLQDYEKGVRWRDIRVKVEAADGVGRLRCAVISLVAMITGDPADIIGSSNDALADAVNKAMDSLMAQRKANANAEDAEALLKTTITSNDRLRRALVSLTCACAGDKATGMGEQDGYIVAAAGAAAAGIADERKNADYRVRLTNAKAEGAEKLRQSLASLICACGGDASDASSDGYLIDAASGCADVIMRRRQDKPTPEQMAMAVAEALKSALDQFKKG